MSGGKHHELFDFIAEMSQGLTAEYQRIQKRATEDPGTAGDQGEENWKWILGEWLPHTYHVVTKGRILGWKSEASPQVDVLVLYPGYPRFLLDKKLYLAAGVAAAFECKLTLKASHIWEALEKAARIRRLLTNRSGSPYKELNSSLIFGLLAHSHSWDGEDSDTINLIEKRLYEADKEWVAHPRESLDIACVADLATWVAKKKLLTLGLFPIDSSVKVPFNLADLPPLLISSYDRHAPGGLNQAAGPFTPIGTLLYALLIKLAWEDPSLRSMAEYFFQTGVGGPSEGQGRQWDPRQVLSPSVADLALKGKGFMASKEFANDVVPWNEWCMADILLGH